MKRIQPYYFLIGLAALFVFGGMILYSARGLTLLKQGTPIEPQTCKEKGDLFELWFTGADLTDLSVDRNVTGIVFGTGSKKVTLLDRDRRLQWEKSFSSNPLQTKISAGGNYLAVGTEGGALFFMSTDQKLWWQEELDLPVYLVALSANGRWVLIARGSPEQNTHYLELYDGHDGAVQWSMPTGPLQQICLAGEQPNQGMVFFSCERDGTATAGAITLAGESLWEKEGVALAAVSRTGSRVALAGSDSLTVCKSQGDILWEMSLPQGFNTSAVLFNPQNNYTLLYGSGDGINENLYYFGAEGKVLWKKKIAEGALISFTADGNRIITSSWRHYKEDYSQMVFLDEGGETLSVSLELGMRVERLLVSTNRRYIVIGGEDGYIDVIDLDEELVRENVQPSAVAPFYSPAAAGLDKGQLAVTLYFNSDDRLVPVSRLIGQTEDPLRAAIDELVQGPSRESELNRLIPKDVGFDVAFDGAEGRLMLDFSPELAQASGSFQTRGMLDSLIYTVGFFPEVKEIYLTVNKTPLRIPDDGLVLEQPFQPHRWRDPIFIPMRIKERYYIVPREARDVEIERRDLAGLLSAVVRHCRTFYFVPGDLALIDVQEKDGIVEINLNSSFRLLLPESGGTEEQLQAAMVLDALFLTAAENSESRYIEIHVDGENWSPPQGFPPLGRSTYKPYYINPEF